MKGLQQLVTDAAVGIANGVGDLFSALGTMVNDALGSANSDLILWEPTVPCAPTFCG
jgi:hypothetical protein